MYKLKNIHSTVEDPDLEIEAVCYTEALQKALESLGYKVEAYDDPDWVQSEEFEEPKEDLEKIVKQEEQKEEKKVPFTEKTLEVFNLLKKDYHTLSDIVMKTGIAISTAKQLVNYRFKKEGYIVEAVVMPGQNEPAYMIK